jgi:hypothetical protein
MGFMGTAIDRADTVGEFRGREQAIRLHRDHIMLARRFAAHLDAYADHWHELRRRKRPAPAVDNSGGACG